MNEKEIPQLVQIKTISKQGQMIINGQVIQQNTSVLVCPCCGNIIYDFGREVDGISIRRISTEQSESLYKIAHYCPQCGQKLQYEHEVIEGE